MISFHDDATPICGFSQSVVAHADRAEHPARGGPLQAVGDVAGAGLDVRACESGMSASVLARPAAYPPDSWE